MADDVQEEGVAPGVEPAAVLSQPDAVDNDAGSVKADTAPSNLAPLPPSTTTAVLGEADPAKKNDKYLCFVHRKKGKAEQENYRSVRVPIFAFVFKIMID